MKSLTEQSAVLIVHEGSPGQYILRVGDTRYRSLVIEVTKLLPDAESFILVTPNDVKVFSVRDGEGRAGGGTTEIPDEGQIELLGNIPPAETPDQAAAVGDSDPAVDNPSPDAATQTRRTRRRKPYESASGHDETCGRCKGVGRIAVLLEGGSAGDAPCPICKGEGIMKRYGARR